MGSGSVGTPPIAPTIPNSQNSDHQHPIAKSKTNPADAGKTIVITPKDAGKYEGKQATVEFKVAASRTLPDKKISFLDWTTDSEDPQSFTVFIDGAASSKFKSEAKIDDPPEYYRTKQIRVSGTVKRYRERLEINVTSPHQIEIVTKDKDKSAP